MILGKVFLDVIVSSLNEHLFETGKLIQIGGRWRSAKSIAIVATFWAITIQIGIEPTVSLDELLKGVYVKSRVF